MSDRDVEIHGLLRELILKKFTLKIFKVECRNWKVTIGRSRRIGIMAIK
jgi:hypothetical protein